jgi:hypothetical protein
VLIQKQEYEGKLSFATDAWTSPNHKAYVAVTVHLEMNGEPVSMILDVVEVAKVKYLLASTISTLTVSRRTPGLILLQRLQEYSRISVLRTRSSALLAITRPTTTR